MSAECAELPALGWFRDCPCKVRRKDRSPRTGRGRGFRDWLGERQANTLVLLDSAGVSVVEQDLTILLGSKDWRRGGTAGTP